jgi:hypothetical protein
MSDLAVEQIKRKGGDRCIKYQRTASSDKRIKCQDLKKINRFDKQNS